MRQATRDKTAALAVRGLLGRRKYADFGGTNRFQSRTGHDGTSDGFGFSDPSPKASQFTCQENPLKNDKLCHRTRKNLRTASRGIAQNPAHPDPRPQPGSEALARPSRALSEAHSGRFSRPVCVERRPKRQPFSSDFPHWPAAPSRALDAHIARERPSNSLEHPPHLRAAFVGLKIAHGEREDRA